MNTIDLISCEHTPITRSVHLYDNCVENISDLSYQACSKVARTARTRHMKRRREERERHLRLLLVRFMLIALVTVGAAGTVGIVTRAQNTPQPVAYKYYDAITVAYRESFLDIVERYDDRAHYETQEDYIMDLCRINSIPYDGMNCPEVTPGTRLVVPYYSAEIK